MRKLINWIMGVFGIMIFNLQLLAEPNTNVTTDPGLSVENKTFYDMALIEEASPNMTSSVRSAPSPRTVVRKSNSVSMQAFPRL